VIGSNARRDCVLAVTRGWVDPFAAALALREEPGLVLLESAPGFGDLGRRSLLAARPSEVAVEGITAIERTEKDWWAGWLSYDLGRELELLPELAADELGLPPLALGRYDAHLEFDHETRAVAVVGDGDASHLLRALERAEKVEAPPHRRLELWDSSLPTRAYECAVARAIDYIRAGDVFQVNLSHRLSTRWSGDPFGLYARLRRVSPAPFMALVRLGGADVISASPERFLRRRGTHLETRPIKGTRPRGRSPVDDRALAQALADSAKDRAENIMIVDLARNDIGRVARYGTVNVRELCALESHPGVHHLVSVVDGRVPKSTSATDIVRASFPPGSVTGAPKIRAMEIIEGLEPVRRGVYCGSVGWIGGGDLDLSVAIRTFIAAEDRLHLHVGGAVVADSDPALEWRETMHKAARLLEAAGGRLRDPVRERPRPLRGPRRAVDAIAS
jgi:para-aminobenzoate synthetase component 1